MKKNEYQCANCGGIYGKAWSDEEAMQEASLIWGEEGRETPLAIICDDCFKEGLPRVFEDKDK